MLETNLNTHKNEKESHRKKKLRCFGLVTVATFEIYIICLNKIQCQLCYTILVFYIFTEKVRGVHSVLVSQIIIHMKLCCVCNSLFEGHKNFCNNNHTIRKMELQLVP